MFVPECCPISVCCYASAAIVGHPREGAPRAALTLQGDALAAPAGSRPAVEAPKGVMPAGAALPVRAFGPQTEGAAPYGALDPRAYREAFSHQGKSLDAPRGGRADVLVATSGVANAGIDGDVRAVFRIDMPLSIFDLVQEIGCAGC